jgi:hypothetical protein
VSSEGSVEPQRNEKPLGEVLKGAAKQALGGGLPGAAAMAMQVSSTLLRAGRCTTATKKGI